MNYAMVAYIIGWILLCEGGLMLLPAFVGVLYAERELWVFVGTAVLCAVLGGALVLLRKPRKRTLYAREGFAITGLVWIVISMMGAVPFVLSGAIPSYLDALFETASGFTTTGASILNQIEGLPYCVLFWRSFTHWIGGMGVLVFLLALLPLTGGSHVNLMKAESPGPQVEKLVPKVQSTAMVLYGIYFGLTLTLAILLKLGGLSLFESINTAFATAGTGGFAIRNDSVASYPAYLQNVLTLFMILFGVNFNAYFLILLGKIRRATAIEEVRWYFGVIAGATALIVWNARECFASIGQAVQQVVFQVASVITTTGFATWDFDQWPNFSKTIMVILMFCGACAGSTGGGMKVSRFIILFRSIRNGLNSYLHPKSVQAVRMDGKVVSKDVINALYVYLGAYAVVFVASLLLVSLNGYDLVTNFTSVATTLNNVGPGLNLVGPTCNFSFYSPLSKLVLIFDMIAGRLELLPMLLLFNRETWKKF